MKQREMGSNGPQTQRYQDALRTLTYQLSNYTAWMNGTGSTTNFTVPDRDVTVAPLLESFKIGGGLLDPITSSYYSNITGTFHGDTKFYNITPPFLNNTAHEWSPLAEQYMAHANMSLILDKTGAWNWSASDKVALSFVEKPLITNASNNIALIHGKIELTDERTSEDLRLDFEGVHFVSNGTVYALIFAFLPSIVPEEFRNETAQIVEPELASRITKLKNLIDAGIVEQEATSDEGIKTSCPFSLYVALDLIKVPENLLREYEEEIQQPAGIWTIKPPPMSISGLLMSKECGILYEFHKAEGVGLSSLFRKLTTYAGTIAIAYLLMLVLLFRQIQRSRTPSGISRLCYWTPPAVANSPATAIASVPPPPQPTPELPAAPVQAPPLQRNPSFLAFFIQHLRSDPQMRLWVLLFLFLTVVVHTILSATMSIFFVSVTYSFFWLPQIVRSARRGRGSGLSKEYLVGTTLCRLYIALYFLLCPKNVLDIEPRPWSSILAGFVCLQMASCYPPGYSTTNRFQYAATKMYDYHPVMSAPNDSESPDQSLGDCAICMDAIYIDPSLRRRTSLDGKSEWVAKGTSKRKAKGGSAGGILNAVQMGVGSATARKNYSLAPCHHLFWLAIKNICPQCRRPLPPL
ncbi:hypothetical protein B0H14DRAFT_3081695 [Mycena olivaceomarginata]|nr:hypothetical protein B0H14DRAFT_3081695 [Mycena olivaceomarginata]